MSETFRINTKPTTIIFQLIVPGTPSVVEPFHPVVDAKDFAILLPVVLPS